MSESQKHYEICEILKSDQSVMQTIYDIVKAHGGDLKVETKEEKGTTFILSLNINN